MLDLLTALPDAGTAFIGLMSVLALSSIRLLVILTIFPPTADGILSGVIRNAVVMMFSLFIAVGQPASLITALSASALVVTALRELVLGLVLGFAASSVFWVAQSAGTYLDDLTGYNNVQITNPLREEASTPMGTLLGQLASVAFWTFGGMPILLGALYESYHWWPLASAGPIVANVLQSFVLQQTDSLMTTTAKLAAPLLLLLLLVDFAFAIGAKSASKLDLMGLSQPVKGALAVLMLGLFVGVFVDQVKDQLVLTQLSAQMRAIASAMHDAPTP
jgi:type III secretion protein T